VLWLCIGTNLLLLPATKRQQSSATKYTATYTYASDVDSTSRALYTEKARLISVTIVLFIVVLLLVIITTLSVAWFFFQRRKQNNDKKKQFESVQTRIKISSDHYSEDENKA